MIIGVDVGTSLTKAVAYDDAGVRLAHAEAPSRVDYLPGDRVEQDLEQVVGTIATVVREVVAQCAEPVTAITLTGQGDGLWLRDADGRASRPPISWLDGRAGGLLERWRADGVTGEVYRRTGSGLFPGSHAPLLAYLDKHEPEALDGAVVAGYCVDAVVQRLTGRVTVNITDASFPFLDPVTRTYDETALAACGLSARRNLLADPAAPLTVFELSADGARLLGLPAGLPVVQAPFDLPSCAIGAGVDRPGDGLLIVGTTLACEVLTDRVDFDRDGEPSGQFLTMPWPDRYLRALPAMVGTACLDWVCALLNIEITDVDRLLAAGEPGANGVLALPFLAPGGERAPFVEPAASAQLFGMRLGTTPADVLRAVCEGVAYAARNCLDAAGRSGELWACGGGVRSTEWTKIFADVLGRPIVIPADEGIGTRGAAIVAAEALGSGVDRAEWTGRTRTVEFSQARHDRYEAGYADYLARLAEARMRWGSA